MGKQNNTFIFYFYLYMQQISVIFKPSYIWSNIFFKMQKNMMYSKKISINSIYKILSSCLPLNSCKSFNLFTTFNKNDKNNYEYNYDLENYDNIDNTYILNIYRDIDFDDDYFSPESLFIDKKIRDREAIIDLSDKSLRFYDNKKLTLNLYDKKYMGEKKFNKNNTFSKKIVSLNNRKVNISNSKYQKTYIFEKPEFF